MDRYTFLRDERLGAGTYGEVFRAVDNATGKHVAVKEIHCPTAHAARQAVAEMRAMHALRHENVVQLIETCSTTDATLFIVMELMPGGSLSAVLDVMAFRLHELVIRGYLRHVLRGLAYLHGQGYVHRDLKPGNMLLGSGGEVKLSDFGTCRPLALLRQEEDAAAEVLTRVSKKGDGSGGGEEGQTTVSSSNKHNARGLTGTPCYVAPETVSRSGASTAADIYSVACSIHHLATAQLPWSHLEGIDSGAVGLLYHIGTARPPNHHPPIPDYLSPELQDILARCYAYDPEHRPTAAALLNEPYFVSDAPPPATVEPFDVYNARREAHLVEVAEQLVRQDTAAGVPVTSSSETQRTTRRDSRRDGERPKEVEWPGQRQVRVVEFEECPGQWRRMHPDVEEPLLSAYDRYVHEHHGVVSPTTAVIDAPDGEMGSHRCTSEDTFDSQYGGGMVNRLSSALTGTMDPSFAYDNEEEEGEGAGTPAPAGGGAAGSTVESVFRFSLFTFTYAASFATMQQENQQTQTRRPFRVRSTVVRPPLRPCFLADNGQWIGYIPEVSSLIVEALTLGNRTVRTALGPGQAYDIDLAALVQTNVETLTRRNVSLHEGDRLTPFVVEYWQPDGPDAAGPDGMCGGRWVPFHEAVGRVVARAQQDGLRSLRLSSGNNHYEMDFERMSQTNVHTGMQRPIQIRPLEWAAPPP